MQNIILNIILILAHNSLIHSDDAPEHHYNTMTQQTVTVCCSLKFIFPVFTVTVLLQA